MTDEEHRLRGADGEDEGMIGIELTRSHRQRQWHELGICNRRVREISWGYTLFKVELLLT